MIRHCPRCGTTLPPDARIVRKEGAVGCAPVYKVTHALPCAVGEKPRICGGYTGPPYAAGHATIPLPSLPPTAMGRVTPDW